MDPISTALTVGLARRRAPGPVGSRPAARRDHAATQARARRARPDRRDRERGLRAAARQPLAVAESEKRDGPDTGLPTRLLDVLV